MTCTRTWTRKQNTICYRNMNFSQLIVRARLSLIFSPRSLHNRMPSEPKYPFLRNWAFLFGDIIWQIMPTKTLLNSCNSVGLSIIPQVFCLSLLTPIIHQLLPTPRMSNIIYPLNSASELSPGLLKRILYRQTWLRLLYRQFINVGLLGAGLWWILVSRTQPLSTAVFRKRIIWTMNFNFVFQA